MKKILIGLFVGSAALLYTGCEDSAVGGENNENVVSKVDTVYVSSKDTMVVKNVDTLVLHNIDTLVLSKVDTVLAKDTIYSKDTVVLNDTIHSVDTLVIKDTLVVKDTVVMVEGAEGTVKDARDGKVYKTIKIGEQVWMAENLNFDYGIVDKQDDALSYCYGDLAGSCRLYGRLYTWSAAMDSVGLFSDDGVGCGYGRTCSPKAPVRGICMKGWHLPSSSEWQELVDFVGASTASKVLRSKDEWSWDDSGDTRKVTYGTDKYGFSILPYGAAGAAKRAYGYSGFNTSTEVDEEYRTLVTFWGSGNTANFETADKAFGASADRGAAVRCVRD